MVKKWLKTWMKLPQKIQTKKSWMKSLDYDENQIIDM